MTSHDATPGESLPTPDLLRIAVEAGANFDAPHPECLRGFSLLKFTKLLKERFAPSAKAPNVTPMPTCVHPWDEGNGPMPASWYCNCGAKVYRSYEDAVDD